MIPSVDMVYRYRDNIMAAGLVVLFSYFSNRDKLIETDCLF